MPTNNDDDHLLYDLSLCLEQKLPVPPSISAAL
jgi:hypothetical protein